MFGEIHLWIYVIIRCYSEWTSYNATSTRSIKNDAGC